MPQFAELSGTEYHLAFNVASIEFSKLRNSPLHFLRLRGKRYVLAVLPARLDSNWRNGGRRP